MLSIDMKKILITIVVALSALISNARSDAEVVAGMNVATFDNSAASSRIGFHAGVRINFGIPSTSQGLYANAAALLSLRGAQASNITFNPFYLDVPIHLGYKYAVSENVGIFGEFGPYVAVGLFGSTEGEDVFGDHIGMKRFDAGLGLRAGVEFNRKVNASLGYDFGLVDVTSETKLKNRNFYISLGYKF